jgi:hypothetical protein
MEKLPEDFKQRWIAALRSGEYKQGADIMYNKRTDCYCCLGVASAICGVSKELMEVGYFYPTTTNVPKEFPSLILTNTKIRDRLITMNDTDEKSFSEIADWIEANL